jgi:hypothetical protein
MCIKHYFFYKWEVYTHDRSQQIFYFTLGKLATTDRCVD